MQARVSIPLHAKTPALADGNTASSRMEGFLSVIGGQRGASGSLFESATLNLIEAMRSINVVEVVAVQDSKDIRET